MPKTLKNFADSERAREYRNRQRERNYALCPGDDDVRHTRWQDWERELVMEHTMPDREISRMTGRSVRAIQVMRHKLRKTGRPAPMSKLDGDLIQSVLWYAMAAAWALIAIARWLSGEPEGSDAMTHFGIAFILANIFELRSEMGKIGEK